MGKTSATKYPPADASARTGADWLLLESPRDIPAGTFGMDDPTEQARLVLKLSNDPRAKVIDHFGGANLVRVGNTIFVKEDGKLIYFVRWIDQKFAALPRRHCTQIAVWVRGGEPAGLPRYVFWNHIFPIRKTMMTDTRQTTDGRRFWRGRIKESLERSLFVYRLNIVQHRCDRVKTIEDYEKWTHTSYGDKTKHEDGRLVITDEAVA